MQLTDDRGAQIIVKRNGCRKLEIIDKGDIAMSTPVLASHGGHQGAEYYPAIQLSLPSPKTNNKVPVSWGGVLGGRTDLIPLEQIQPMPKSRRNNSSNTPYPLKAELLTTTSHLMRCSIIYQVTCHFQRYVITIYGREILQRR